MLSSSNLQAECPEWIGALPFISSVLNTQNKSYPKDSEMLELWNPNKICSLNSSKTLQESNPNLYKNKIGKHTSL